MNPIIVSILLSVNSSFTGEWGCCSGHLTDGINTIVWDSMQPDDQGTTDSRLGHTFRSRGFADGPIFGLTPGVVDVVVLEDGHDSVLFIQPQGDFNNDGVTNVQDIFDFLSAWFAGDSSADTDLNGLNTVQDIFNFLFMWFNE